MADVTPVERGFTGAARNANHHLQPMKSLVLLDRKHYNKL